MHRMSSRDLALVATFTGLVAALGLVPAVYPAGIPVPITAQTLGVMLAGAIIGRWRGAASLVLLLVLVAVGLPLLAGGRGGLGAFAGPSVGYLVGFPFGAWVIGWLTEKGGAPYRLSWGLVANLVGGIVVVYVFGILGTAWRANLSIEAATVAAGWYVVGDLAKAVIAALVARGVHAAYPGLLPGRRTAARTRRGASTPV
ncbi:MAG TPA: biotin transporter BioY [Marmoricola sp.]|nr:biotin transporter BioY [Marmoricola sp.]